MTENVKLGHGFSFFAFSLVCTRHSHLQQLRIISAQVVLVLSRATASGTWISVRIPLDGVLRASLSTSVS